MAGPQHTFMKAYGIFSEGKVMAVRYGSKYTETSVTLNDCVDQLLVGIVRQIRLTKELEANPKKKSEIRSRTGSLQVGPPGRTP